MNALLIGGGHLGTFLKERLKPKHHHIGKIEEITEEQLDTMNVNMVVNTAGKTSLEFCEKNPLQAFDSNVIQPLKLFRKIKDQIFVQISSGCIWDGPYDENGHPFDIASPPSPACFYSWTKVCCEAVLREEHHSRKLVILRPRQVYSPVISQRNTLTKMLSYPRLIDTPNSMTSAETIAKTIEYVENYDDFNCGPLIMNVFDKGIISPFRVGQILSEFGLRGEPILMSKDELDKNLTPRRVDTVLNDCRFSFEVNPPKIEDEVRRVVAEYKANLKK